VTADTIHADPGLALARLRACISVRIFSDARRPVAPGSAVTVGVLRAAGATGGRPRAGTGGALGGVVRVLRGRGTHPLTRATVLCVQARLARAAARGIAANPIDATHQATATLVAAGASIAPATLHDAVATAAVVATRA